MSKLITFKDLLVWKEGHKLVIDIYSISKRFPNYEQFGLTNQIRRASVSITSNIAEGFVRKGKKEKVQFYYMALGSLMEVRNQTQIAFDIKYINENDFNNMENQAIKIGRLINSLIRSTNNRQL